MADSAGMQVAKWGPTERILAIICVLSPILMSRIDAGPLRESISHYYAMDANQWFYVPLAIAAMLFVVNGITNEQHWYNCCPRHRSRSSGGRT